MDIDEVYIRTGEFGAFQRKAFLGCCLASVFSGWQMVQNIFAGAVPFNQTCITPEIEACDANCSNVLFPDDNFQSFATEWGMTCGSDMTIVHSTQSIYVAGIMTGSFIFGGLGDRFGRFPVLMACHMLCAFFAMCSSFANVWLLYTVIRFLTGFFQSGQIIVSFVLTSELVGPSKRGVISAMGGTSFAVGIATLSLSAWITQNWRINSIVLAGGGLLLSPLLYALYDESPRWYLSKGNMKKCHEVLRRITTTNGHNLDDLNLKLTQSHHNSSKETKTNMLSLLKHKILRKISLIQFFSWFTVSAVYYGLTIASGDMGSDRYTSVILSAISEIPSNIITWYIMEWPRCGRVRTCTVGLIMSGLLCGSIWFVPDSHSTIIICLAFSGKFFNCIAFAIVYVQAGELYPTAVRNVGLGAVSVFNRVGGILAPQIVNLNNLYHNAHFIVFGVLGVVAGFLVLLLPETLGRPLPTRPEDIYNSIKKVDSDIIKPDVQPSDKQSLVNNIDEDDENMESITM